MDLWYRDVQALSTQTTRTVSKSKYSRREKILVWYDKSINNGFAEAINSTQTIRRMARGFKNIDCFIAMVYLYNGRSQISFDRDRTVLIVKQALGFGMQNTPQPSAAFL